MRNSNRRHQPRQYGYPRPQLVRENWTSLNGTWDFAVDPEARIADPNRVQWDQHIEVPFSPETPLSGVGDTSLYKAVWYRRQFEAPALSNGQRLILHCGAVDSQSAVWINGQLAMRHEGGYTPFRADITHLLGGAQFDSPPPVPRGREKQPPTKESPTGTQTIIVHALDDPADLAKPRGKQDWRLEPHSIWYYRTTGIWQTVWLEVVSQTYLENLRWTADAERWEIGLDVRLGGRCRRDLQLHLKLSIGERLLVEDTYSLHSDEISRRIGIPDPGIDDYRNEMLWTPEHPKLIDAVLELKDPAGHVLDRVTSYTALRSIALLGNRFVLNGKPYKLHMVLDQGYWPQSGLTAPDDDALRHDVELAKSMGFNGVRKHQKIEDPRYLYWADRLGLLVWEEMPSAYRFSRESPDRLTRQWTEAISRDISHPCIVAWVPFNESWGVPDLPSSPAQRNFVRALYHLTKTLDPSRPVVGNDGWEAIATDIVTIHDYDADPDRIARRYATVGEGIVALLRDERPGHKLLTLSEFRYQNQPIMLTEFGGIAFSRDPSQTWGYSRVTSAQDFARRYFLICSAVRSLPLLAGFCYTQFADTYQEANGLLYMDRTPKFPLNEIAIATRGPTTPQDIQVEATWRGTAMGTHRRGRTEPKVRAGK